MSRLALILLIAALSLPAADAAAWPWDKKKVDPNAAKKKQLAALNAKLQSARDDLQGLIASRWQKKQAF